MVGIYLGAYRALHPAYYIVYQDINGKRDVGGDMLDVDLSPYDFVIATPPCNFWSRSNYRRYSSEYSMKTRHLLPCILLKLHASGKPFIVENVRNSSLMFRFGCFHLPLYVYEVGRHTYWSNVFLGDLSSKQNIEHIQNHRNQGAKNVHDVIEVFLAVVSDRLA